MVKWAKKALEQTESRTGWGPSMDNVEKILTLAKESNWIVDSINNWDSNAKAGNPSGGLMHITIDKVGGSKQRLYDPVDNIATSILYQKGKYGRLVTNSPYERGGIVGEAETGIPSLGTLKTSAEQIRRARQVAMKGKRDAPKAKNPKAPTKDEKKKAAQHKKEQAARMDKLAKARSKLKSQRKLRRSGLRAQAPPRRRLAR